VQPDLVYACTKHSAEHVCQSYAKNYGMDVVVCRFFNVYGPHQDIERASPPFTSYVARELLHGRPPNLFNRSDAKRDYVHVADVCALLLNIMRSASRFRADVFNVCSGVGHSVPELYDIFQTISGSALEAVYDDPTSFWDRYAALFEGPYPLARERIAEEVRKHSVGSPEKARVTFQWEPAIDIVSGIRSVYADAERRFLRGR
jgi:nucleoside-diphosphate-sugar epimerase